MYLYFFQEEVEVQQSIDKRKIFLAQYNLTLRPFVALVGDLEKTFSSQVRINETVYRFNSPLKAIDACLKCIVGLDCEYAIDSKNVWGFLEKRVYDIERSTISPFVST